MNKLAFLFVIFLCLACTAEPVDISQCAIGGKSGFWLGLWHGLIAVLTFFISLFTDSVTIYDVNNNGGWYDFGFVLGAGILLKGSSASIRRRRISP